MGCNLVIPALICGCNAGKERPRHAQGAITWRFLARRWLMQVGWSRSLHFTHPPSQSSVLADLRFRSCTRTLFWWEERKKRDFRLGQATPNSPPLTGTLCALGDGAASSLDLPSAEYPAIKPPGTP